jgi:hypothetical protein
MKFNLTKSLKEVGDDFAKGTSLYKRSVAIKEEVLRHKWIESEKAGYDIGFEWAMVDWVCRHKSNWERYQDKMGSSASK